MEIIGLIIVVGLALSLVAKILGGFGFLISRASAKGALARAQDFSPAISEFFRKGQGLSIDTARRRLAIIQPGRGVAVFGYGDIVAAEVCKNGETLTLTNRGSQVVGAMVGAVLLGPLGLLVGAVTGSKRSTEKIKKLSLKIYTNDLRVPVREIVFYDGAATEPKAVASHAARLEQWYGRLRTIVEGRAAPADQPTSLPLLGGPSPAFGRRPRPVARTG